MQEPSDEALMLNYSAGNSEAFASLYARYKGPLYRYLVRQCQNSAVAEELYQDTWECVMGARDSYAPTAKFSTWLYTIAHHRAVDHHRRERGFIAVPVDSDSDDDMPHPVLAAPESQQPEHLADRQQQVGLFFAALDRLPAEQREAFVLQEEGLSLDAIATVTQTNVEAVKSRVRYAITKLRRALGNGT